jgi:RHS repeat-associated protein
VNSSGSVVGSYSYEPFGKSTASGSASTPFEFTGRENDGTGLYYYRARYYSPLYQRFIAQDPLDFRGELDLYAYVLNMATVLRDLLGLDPFWLPAGPAGPACTEPQLLNGASPPAVTANLLDGLNIDEYFATSTNGGLTFMSDALGSTLGLVNSSGAIAGSYSYEPFGKSTASGSATTPFEFTGRENDGTGLYYNRARYYDPLYQRFFAQDPVEYYQPGAPHFPSEGPIEYAASPNLYEYANGDPITFTSPVGVLSMLVFGRQPPGVDGGNGNLQPGFSPQDWKCTVGSLEGALGHPNSRPCVKKCCVAHDACYGSFGCNWTSWLTMTGPCGLCNATLVGCIIDANKSKTPVCGCS